MHKTDESLALNRTALKTWPGYRALAYAYLDELLQTGHNKEPRGSRRAHTLASGRLALYDLQARAFESSNQALSQHRAQARVLLPAR